MKISYVRVIDDNKIIVLCINNKNIDVLHITNKKTTSKLELIGHSGIITCAIINKNNSNIISSSEDKIIKMWDIINGNLLLDLIGHNKWIYSIDISKNNEYIISGSGDNKILLWGLYRKVIIRKIKSHSDTVTSVKFNSDDSEILSGSCDFTICLSDTKNGKLIKRYVGHEYIISDVSFSNDNTKIISSSFDRTIRLWEKTTGLILNVFQTQTDIARYSITSPTDNLIISCGNKTIFVWCIKTLELLKTFECHDNRVDLVSFKKNGESFYSFGIDEENDILEFFEQKIPKIFL